MTNVNVGAVKWRNQAGDIRTGVLVDTEDANAGHLGVVRVTSDEGSEDVALAQLQFIGHQELVASVEAASAEVEQLRRLLAEIHDRSFVKSV